MDRIFNVAVTGAALVALLLVILYGPVIAAFIVTSASFLLMLGVMAFRGLSLLADWRRTRVH
jgi:hypothetical protein